MKTALHVITASFLGFALIFILMKMTQIPQITFITFPDGEEVVWDAKHSNGHPMSIQEAQEIVDNGGRYVRQVRTLAVTDHNHESLGVENSSIPISN